MILHTFNKFIPNDIHLRTILSFFNFSRKLYNLIGRTSWSRNRITWVVQSPFLQKRKYTPASLYSREKGGINASTVGGCSASAAREERNQQSPKFLEGYLQLQYCLRKPGLSLYHYPLEKVVS
jgi:hypothetical protein